MSRYPHRILHSEKQKRVLIQNSLEDKFLKQKLVSYSREKLYIDRELRRISLAKSSLMESLDRFNTVPRATQKRLSLPCLLDGPRKQLNAKPISTSRRHTVPSVSPDGRQKLKPESYDEQLFPRCKESMSNTGTQLRARRLSHPEDVHEFRVASPVTASLILSGQVDKNRAKNERALFSWKGNMEKAKTGTPLHLPRIPDNATKCDVNSSATRKVPAGQANPRDSMLASSLKSKFRQIGSVVTASAILRIAHEKNKNGN